MVYFGKIRASSYATNFKSQTRDTLYINTYGLKLIPQCCINSNKAKEKHITLIRVDKCS